MSICLKVESYPEFFYSKDNCKLLTEYLDEMMGKQKHEDAKDQLTEYFKDKNFFQINKQEKPIGFGAYKDEVIDGKASFMLYEFFVHPKYRDVSQLYEIRRQIIVALKILDKALWTCCLETDDEKRKRAYEKLGFQPMYEDEDQQLVMGMELENF